MLGPPLNNSIKEALLTGLQSFQIDVLPRQIEQLWTFLSFLWETNHSLNLVGRSSIEEIVLKDFLDCLAALPYFENGKKIIDIGSGAGFPGIPLAIFLDRSLIYLCESKNKKASFLERAVNMLGLSNIRVVCKNIAEIRETFDVLTARAYADIHKIIKTTKNSIHSRSRFILYKGTRQRIEAEITGIPPVWKTEIFPLKIPGLEEERHIIILCKQ